MSGNSHVARGGNFHWQVTASRSLPYLAIGLLAALVTGFITSAKPLSPVPISPPPPAASLAPPLTVEAADLSWGQVAGSQTITRQLRISNTSQSEVTIASFAPSCGCTSVEPPTLRLVAGETRDISVSIDLAAIANITSHETPFEILLRPRLDAHGVSVSPWKISGTLVVPCTIDTSTIVFAGADALIAHRTGRSKYITGTLWNRDYSLSLPDSPPELGARVEGPDDEGNFSLVFSPSTDRECQTFEHNLHILVSDTNGEPVWKTPVRITGTIEPPFGIEPRQIVLGALPVGSQLHQNISLECPGRQVISISTTDSAIAAELAGDLVAQTSLLKATFSVVREGPTSAMIHIECQDTVSTESIAIAIPVSFHGFQAAK